MHTVISDYIFDMISTFRSKYCRPAGMLGVVDVEQSSLLPADPRRVEASREIASWDIASSGSKAPQRLVISDDNLSMRYMFIRQWVRMMTAGAEITVSLIGIIHRYKPLFWILHWFPLYIYFIFSFIWDGITGSHRIHDASSLTK